MQLLGELHSLEFFDQFRKLNSGVASHVKPKVFNKVVPLGLRETSEDNIDQTTLIDLIVHLIEFADK